MKLKISNFVLKILHDNLSLKLSLVRKPGWNIKLKVRRHKQMKNCTSKRASAYQKCATNRKIMRLLRTFLTILHPRGKFWCFFPLPQCVSPPLSMQAAATTLNA